MSKSKKTPNTGAMLELWRPPQDAGEAVGCLASTYTFAPEMFDEQCLARFLEIESEPDREDLAFLLERESRLGGVYAGVLVDHTQAGVAHSLRWDVLPVRIPRGKQHAKISLLAWHRHIRIIVASANLTKAGYRTNYEVAAAVDLTPEDANTELLAAAVDFLRSLVQFVHGASEGLPAVQRAEGFLAEVERRVEGWKKKGRGERIRQHLVFTLPAVQDGDSARSSLDSAVQECRRRGGSPNEAWIASPFFDSDEPTSRVASSLCKLMARGGSRRVCLSVPAVSDAESAAILRLAAPVALLRTPPLYQASVSIKMLPEADTDRNHRPWHAKMIALIAEQYSALMIGSSNFTSAGMGVGQNHNAEANLLTIVDRVAYGRDASRLEAVWPKMDLVEQPETAQWLGSRRDPEEADSASTPPSKAGFLAATYRAGDERRIFLRLDPSELPEDWLILAHGHGERELLSASQWRESGCPPVAEIAWTAVQPPERLRVCWSDCIAFLPLNVEDSGKLPPPSQLEHMSADDMLLILAAADPSAAIRAMTSRQAGDSDDPDLDTAAPIDLDPLRRYDLRVTFLHRIRRRSRFLAQLRANLERPVWGRQALDWRLRGLIGIQSLADRLVREFTTTDGSADEALLNLADLLIVLREVDYQSSDGALPKSDFEEVYRAFLSQLAGELHQRTEASCGRVSPQVLLFWERVLEECRS
jgi:hypothetical protein